MIKLKNILDETFPEPVRDKIIAWKNSLEIGTVIVKEMGRLSQYDELYQYLGSEHPTDDYSNKGEAGISAELSKIGYLLFDHQFGLTIDLFSELPLLNKKPIKLDANWRFLKPDEIKEMQRVMKEHPNYNVDMGSRADHKKDETFEQTIERINRCKLILKTGYAIQ